MKALFRSMAFFVFAVVMMAEASTAADVSIDGYRLYVDGKPYKIKGVCWSPSSKGNPGENHLAERKSEFYKWYKTDVALMKSMGVNTVRTFLDFGLDEKKVFKILDKLYANGIMVIMTVDDGIADEENLENVVNLYKDHPAILMWCIGNEWNRNRYYHKFASLPEAQEATKRMAQKVKALDFYHPVSSVLSHDDISDIGGIVAACPEVDIWGVNMYLGGSFQGFLEDWREFTRGSGAIKPIFVSEFGADAFDMVNGEKDLQAQSDFNNQLWWEVYANLSADNEEKVCLGAAYFEWNDEWWKAGDPYVHDDGGGYAAQPDGFSNEEWYGLVSITRSRRPTYYKLKSRFTAFQTKDTIRLKAVSNEDGGSEWDQWARFYKDGVICFSGNGGGGNGRGINVAVLDRGLGNFEAIENFDTWASGRESARLVEFLDNVEDGRIIMMAVSDEGTRRLTWDAIRTIEYHCGSNEIRNLEYWGSWAIISIKGASEPIVEAINNNKWAELAIDAEVGLDTDGDGLLNLEDTDDDGDGLSDTVELGLGLDPLDSDTDDDGILDGEIPSQGLPDLAVTDIAYKAKKLKVGKKVTFKTTIYNIGEAKSEKFYADCYVIDATGSEQKLRTKKIGKIKPGKKKKAKFKWKITSRGTYTIRVVADSTGIIPEPSDDNNEMEITVNII